MNQEVVNTDIVILVVGAVLCLGVLYWLLSGNEASRLKDQYFRSVQLPRAQAEESLTRHVARLQEKHPGKTESWYLRHVLADLARDRR
ncbi:hypothetical protein [Archangium lansingense]|uniref:Uncharacterized protein n=1 Tax=Archangium lansingense TaxID=2995310 RepID=A0ABT4AJL0_9BACT|nr:hypothetical protein [Archangium lansinium]MCY1081883.1 hypothetical protein [Archangium lansinium]